jgi:hypothetical protein
VSNYLSAESLLYTEEVGKHVIYPYTPLSNVSIYRRGTPGKSRVSDRNRRARSEKIREGADRNGMGT